MSKGCLRWAVALGLLLLAGLVWFFLWTSAGQPRPGCWSPPPLANGDVKGSVRSKYSHDEQVEYACQDHYSMEGGPRRTCKDGAWTGHVRCLKACFVDEDAMQQHNIEFRHSDLKAMTAAHGDAIEFACAKRSPVGATSLRQTCDDGKMQLPTCQ